MGPLPDVGAGLLGFDLLPHIQLHCIPASTSDRKSGEPKKPSSLDTQLFPAMATAVRLHPRPSGSQSSQPAAVNPLPPLIQTPSGLALLELQGTINLPLGDPDSDEKPPEIPLGRFEFPDYKPDALDPSSTAWMKRVHFYVGRNQRLTGEVKKLPRAIAVIRRCESAGGDVEMKNVPASEQPEDLEVVEIVKHKLVFSSRPEPVGSTTG